MFDDARAVFFCGPNYSKLLVLNWKRFRKASSGMLLVARGGFQVGQTAKARKDRRVQSLPMGRGHQRCVSHRSKNISALLKWNAANPVEINRYTLPAPRLGRVHSADVQELQPETEVASDGV
jgi:hypothetical protein